VPGGFDTCISASRAQLADRCQDGQISRRLELLRVVQSAWNARSCRPDCAVSRRITHRRSDRGKAMARRISPRNSTNYRGRTGGIETCSPSITHRSRSSHQLRHRCSLVEEHLPHSFLLHPERAAQRILRQLGGRFCSRTIRYQGRLRRVSSMALNSSIANCPGNCFLR
jgi:hypothetical protein